MKRAGAALLLLALWPAAAAFDLELSAASIQLPGAVAAITDARISCRISAGAGTASCDAGRASARWRGQDLHVQFTAQAQANGRWHLRQLDAQSAVLRLHAEASGAGDTQRLDLAGTLPDLSWFAPLVPGIAGLELAGSGELRMEAQQQREDWMFDGEIRTRQLKLAETSGRYAAEQLDVRLTANGRFDRAGLRAATTIRAGSGQAYVEPIFLDLTAAPMMVQAQLRWDRASGLLALDSLQLDHAGVVRVSGSAGRDAAGLIDAALDFHQVGLGPAFSTYVQPLLAGTRLEPTTLAGRASGSVQVRASQPLKMDLDLLDAGIEAPGFGSGLSGISGKLNWGAVPGDASQLRWTGGHVAKLALGPGEARLRTSAKDFELLAPLRLPLAGGALRVRELAVQRAGAPDMAARFDAEIEPIDLAALCRAFGWPEFGGSLSGRLPGLSLDEREMKLDGALVASAFDGSISVDGLRVLDPLGRVPRLIANIRLRNLDLAALTGAFSFGRIEGRIDGDVDGLRLLDGVPVGFRASLQTPVGDRSRHRISQRAIDNISSIGGGPTGLLSRGVLRFFEDFSYARLGWSCELRDGVCRMDGIEPAANGGYVLVKGSLLPRIDVVGYTRTVDWNTFVTQLLGALEAEDVEVR